MNLKERLLAGERVVGTMLRIARNPAVFYLAKNAGLDFLMFDCEHSNYGFETLHDAFVLGRALEIGTFVRVPCGTKDYISRALDNGATGVMVPMVQTRDDAEAVVRYSKYAPLGDRGYTGGGAHTGYANGKHKDVMEQGNGSVLSIAQIETRLAVENVDDIASMEGIDALLVGPNDLSLSLGIPGDVTNPLEIEAIERVAASCRKHNKAFGLHAGGELLERFDKDLTLIMSLTDADLLTRGFRDIEKLKRKPAGA